MLRNSAGGKVFSTHGKVSATGGKVILTSGTVALTHLRMGFSRVLAFMRGWESILCESVPSNAQARHSIATAVGVDRLACQRISPAPSALAYSCFLDPRSDGCGYNDGPADLFLPNGGGKSKRSGDAHKLNVRTHEAGRYGRLTSMNDEAEVLLNRYHHLRINLMDVFLQTF